MFVAFANLGDIMTMANLDLFSKWEKKIRLYLAEAVHTITLIRDIEVENYINSLNHLPYNSVHTAFCVPPR